MVHRYSLDEVTGQALLVFDLRKTVFVVGAGVSMEGPTGLPGGRELTEFCLEMAVGCEAAEKIQEIWGAAAELVKADCGAFYPFMRLEIILDYVNKVERLLDGPRFLEGFMGFSERPGNRNHRLLYEAAQMGSLVLTTNFDTCIENSKGVGLRFENRNGCSYVAADGGAGVFHLHGVAVQTEELSYTLGATLENVKEGVDPLMGAYLLERFEQSWDVVFVGYSGSDFFDLMPYFADLKLDSESRAVFFLHGQPGEREVEKAENYIKGFSHSYIVYGDTTRFLELVCSGGSVVAAEKAAAGSGCGDWRESFERVLDLRKERQAVIRGQHLIRLTNQIGIRMDLVDRNWMEVLREVINFFWSQDLAALFGSLPDLSATVIGDLKSTVEMMSSLYPGKMMEIQGEFHRLYDEIAGARRNIVSPASVAQKMTVERLFRIVERGEVSPRNFNSATVYAMNRLAKESIRRWVEHRNDEENNGRLDRLENGIQIMLSMPYYKYMYLSYYLGLLKLDQIVSVIRHPEEMQLEKEKRMLEIALEISNIDQLVKVYLNLFRKYRLLYGITGKESHFIQSEKYYEISKAIAQITGMRIDSREVVMGIE